MEFSEEKVTIPFEQKELDGVFSVPGGFNEGGVAVVLTHGAGGDMHIKQLESLAHDLACAGVLCLRFTCKAINFLFRVRVFSAVVNYLKADERFSPSSIFLGGRSMGARTAVDVCMRMCAVQKHAVQGVLCLSFPLNLPGKPLTYIERSKGLLTLPGIPVLFVSGTADNMCEKRLMESIMHVMKSPSAIHWVKDANHGLKSAVNMAQECWNKIHIPFPSAVSTSRIPFTGSVDLLIDCLLADCEKVLTLLCSEVLQTEIRILYELLYVLNNGFRQHKPFRALKQVEQCVNRLKEMKLQAALEDLKEVCPNKFQREAGAEAGDCDVPSQPMLEWLGLKLVGASSLLARTLERCTKAFILTRQHLRLAEFIVLNVVITSMLSRLWTFFRGILGALIPMYRRITELLQNVSQFQPMTYLTDFTLPKDLKAFLCASYPDLQIEEAPSKTAKRKRKSKFSLLSKLFEETEQEDDNREQMMMPVLAADPYEGSSLDLGAAVSQRRPDVSPYGLDIKIMLQQSCKTTKQMSLEKQMKLDGSVYQKRRFLKSLKEVSSFRNMAVQLKEMISWSRSCKFNQERKWLAFLSLKCLRMESLEAEGIRVERRLKMFKLKVQKTLMLQKTKPNRSFTAFWRTRWQNRFFLAHYKTLKPRSTNFRKSSTVKHSVSLLQTSKVVVSDKNVSVAVAKEQLDSPTMLHKPNLQKDDIDDIFESFGL